MMVNMIRLMPGTSKNNAQYQGRSINRNHGKKCMNGTAPCHGAEPSPRRWISAGSATSCMATAAANKIQGIQLME